ncbi:MAG: sulfotransferase domain-containing protein [Cyclobacteriaceae bacterium]
MNIVHIGYPKTATTFLQWEVFPNLEGVNYVDYRTCEQIFTPLIYLDEFDYDLSSVQETLKAYVLERTNLFSFEGLVGPPFIYKGLGRSVIPERLRALGFDKIIITLRNQEDMLDSLYRQYVIQGGVVRFADFIDRKKRWNLYQRSFNMDFLKYDSLICKCNEIFGKDNVLVLRTEDLKKDTNAFINQIEYFVGSDMEKGRPSKKVNQSMSNLSIAVLRVVNHFIFTSQKPNNLIWNRIGTKYVSKVFLAILEPYIFRFISSRKSFLTKGDMEYVRKYYAESNERLNEALK